MKIDLHMHTFYSDSFSSPEEIVRKAIEARLCGIAITDHNQFEGARRAVKFAKGKQIMVIAGEEIMTDKGEVIGLFLKEKIEPGPFEKVIEDIKKQNGIVIFPHPCDRLRRGVLKSELGLAALADGIEVFNARVIFGEDNIKAKKLCEKYGKAQTGGSDAHFLLEVGAGWTEFEGNGEEDFRKAIEKRKTIAGGNQSPLYVHGFGKVASFVNRFRR